MESYCWQLLYSIWLSSTSCTSHSILPSQSCQATVQTEEEDEASNGEDAEVINNTEPNAAPESSESDAEASEDELGK